MKRDLPRRSRFNRARPAERAGARRGVLLWLLPYLVLSLLGNAPHSHGPNQASGARVAAHLVTAHVAGVQISAPALEAGEGIECLLCVWASSSLGTIAAPKYLHLARCGVVRGPPTREVLLSALISGCCNRGPPLS